MLVTVNPIDDPPVVINPLGIMTFQEDSEDSLVYLSVVFDDVDNENSLISVSIEENAKELEKTPHTLIIH